LSRDSIADIRSSSAPTVSGPVPAVIGSASGRFTVRFCLQRLRVSPSISDGFFIPAASTSAASVQVPGFEDIGRLTHCDRLVCDFCSSGHSASHGATRHAWRTTTKKPPCRVASYYGACQNHCAAAWRSFSTRKFTTSSILFCPPAEWPVIRYFPFTTIAGTPSIP